MKVKIKFSLFLFLIAFSCNDDEVGTSPDLTVCNDILSSSCLTPQNVTYCTFGYKFGDSNPYLPKGAGIPGPQVKIPQISFKFQEAVIVFKSFRQNKAVSLFFSEEEKSWIRTTISKWSSVADFSFIEKPSNEVSDIIIISAFIPIGAGGGQLCAFGNPAFDMEPCKQTAGYMVINSKCRPLSIPIVLHEMGHVLGLGHVLSENVMNPKAKFDQLQSGDILGIKSIYGSK